MIDSSEQVSRLECILTEFYTAPSLTATRRQELEACLENFKRSEGAWTHACSFLSQSPGQASPYLLYFSALVLEHSLLTQQIPKEELGGLATFLCNFLGERDQQLQTNGFVRTKLAQVAVLTGLQGETPEGSFLGGLIGFCTKSLDLTKTSPASFLLLATAAEAYASKDVNIHPSRKEVLNSSLTALLPSILQLLRTYLQTAVANIQEHGPSVQLCVQSFLTLLSWAPLTSELIAADLFTPLFQLIEAAAARPEQRELCEIACTAIACLSEVLSKKMIPPGFQEVVISIANHMITVLQGMSVNRNAQNNKLNEDLTKSMAEFIAVFMENHFMRITKTQSYPLGDFFQALASFTFCSSNPHHITIWQHPWQIIANHLTTEECDLQAEIMDGLSNVANTLMRCMLFSSNSELGCLSTDEDDYEVASKQFLTESFEGNAFTMDNSSRTSTSELGKYLQECKQLLLTLAQLPLVTQKIAPDILQNISQVYGSLNGDANSELTSAQLLNMYDAATLFSLLPAALLSQSDPTNIIQVGTAIVDWVHQMITSRFHSKGMIYTHLQVCGINALECLISGLAMIVLSFPDSSGQVLALVEQIATAMVGALDCTIAPPPENLLVAATWILYCLCQHLPPALVSQAAFPQNLVGSVRAIASPLPSHIQGRLYICVTRCLLPPQLLVGSCRELPDLEGRISALTDVTIKPLSGQVHAFLQGSELHGLASLETSCHCVALVLTSLKLSPNRLKTVLASTAGTRELAEASMGLLAHLLQVVSSDETPSRYQGQMWRHVQVQLQLMISLIGCLRKELGSEFITNCVSAAVQAIGVTTNPFLIGTKRGVSVLCSIVSLLATSLDSPSVRLPKALMMETCKFSVSYLSPESVSQAFALPQLQPKITIEDALAEIGPCSLSVIEKMFQNYWDYFGCLSKDGKREFNDNEMKHVFISFFQIICQFLINPSCSPDVIRQTFSLLLDASKARHVCNFLGLTPEVLESLVQAIIQNLLSQSHRLFQDEQIQLLHLLVVQMQEHYEKLLSLVQQVLLAKFERLGATEQQDLLQNCISAFTPQDFPTFRLRFMSFIETVDHYIKLVTNDSTG